MRITPAAADMLRDLLRRSDIPHPVIYLVQASDTPPELARAVKREAAKAELRYIASKVLPEQPRFLYPAIYPRSYFLWLTKTIEAFPFAPSWFHPPAARCALKKGLLDVAERGLVLKDANGTIVLPSAR